MMDDMKILQLNHRFLHLVSELIPVHCPQGHSRAEGCIRNLSFPLTTALKLGVTTDIAFKIVFFLALRYII